MKAYLKKKLPSPIAGILQRILNSIRILWIDRQIIYCPLCEKKVDGLWCFSNQDLSLKCPDCQSLSRHRLVALWTRSEPDHLKSKKAAIHFAAEKCLTDFFKKNHAFNYITADLNNKADLVVNIENSDLASESFDFLVANHVLEHVNDNEALKEIWRILRPNGVALITVPLVASWNLTYENDQIETPQDRGIHFGQFDHRRFYGLSIRDKFFNAGFECREFVCSGLQCVEYGLERGEILFILSK
jgi:SAM-dependent methyltransferase